MNSSEAYKGFISFLILSGAIGITFLSFRFIGNATNIISVASNEGITPKYIEVSSITTNSVTLSWYTDTPLKASIVYSNATNCFEDTLNESCILISEQNQTKNHELTLKNLNPNTTYYYKIQGDGYLYPQNDFLSFITLPTSNEPSEPEAFTIKDNIIVEPDYEGFSDTSDDQVLGISTKSNVQQRREISSKIVEEFKEALIYNNLKYDFDKNGKVENADYSLFVQFIKNPED